MVEKEIIILCLLILILFEIFSDDKDSSCNIELENIIQIAHVIIMY